MTKITNGLRIGLTALMIAAVLLGCSPTVKTTSSGTAAGLSSTTALAEYYPITVQDFSKREITIKERPQKVVFLANSGISVWYELGGKAVASVNVTENLKLKPDYEAEIRALKSVGHPNNPNLEAILAEDPDLVVAQEGMNPELLDKIRGFGVNVLNFRMKSYDDLKRTFILFGDILEETGKAYSAISEISQKMRDLIAQKPLEDSRVAVLFINTKGLYLKAEHSVAGEYLRELGFKNVASGIKSPDGSENLPLDIEFLAKEDPDIIMVTSMMESNEAAMAKAQAEFSSNPVWAAIPAIREGRIGYLPQQYFLYNAGPCYADGALYIMNAVYPEVFAKPE